MWETGIQAKGVEIVKQARILGHDKMNGAKLYRIFGEVQKYKFSTVAINYVLNRCSMLRFLSPERISLFFCLCNMTYALFNLLSYSQDYHER
jgi:hypothetical protein